MTRNGRDVLGVAATCYFSRMTEQSSSGRHHLRFHRAHAHLLPVFGADGFARAAEAFARFFGTPAFLIGQTALVTAWIVANGGRMLSFDPYPFILLNLAFSLQAAYAAPLILLAQTRQADRDKANAEADACHREALAVAAQERQELMAQQSRDLLELLQRNTELTEMTKALTERIEALTAAVHEKVASAR